MTTNGGGWTKVAQQFESAPVLWTGSGDPVSSASSFSLFENQLPTDRTQIAFGKDNDPTFIDYSNFVYTTGDIPKTLLTGLKTGKQYHVHRDQSFYYAYHNPETTTGTLSYWTSTLTYDEIGGALGSWVFAPLHGDAVYRGYGMGGFLYTTSQSYAWTVWVR